VHAGTHETFGLVLLEAMACGRPVVAMRAGAVPEFVDERAGVLAEPHENPDTAARHLAGAISGLYERDLGALGAAARRHVVTNYSWSRALQSLMARYQSAMASRIPAGLRGLARAETTTP
jgi:alpha-1,6-mannosyltransferase